MLALSLKDVALLNAMPAHEYFGAAAGEIALGSGPSPAQAVNLVKAFQAHHGRRRDELAAAARRLALRCEKGAASAYLGLIAPSKNTEFHEVVARLAADEAAHAAVFMGDLGEPFPERAHIFG